MRTLITAGVDGMFTNFPATLDGVLGKRRVSRYRRRRAGGQGVGRAAARRARKRARA